MKTYVEAKKCVSPSLVSRHMSAKLPVESHQFSGRADIRRILRGPKLQAKLTVGAPDDLHEQEADRVADEVMRMPAPQRQTAPT